MVFNITSAAQLDKTLELNSIQALLHQLFYGFAGIFLGLILYKIGYQNLVKISPILLALSTVSLLLVYVPFIGVKINGARRWIQLLGYTFQPSEVAKFLLPLFFIHQITKKKERNFKELLQIFSWIAIPLFLIWIEPDNGTVALIMITLVVLLFLAKIQWKYWLLPLGVFLLVGGVLAYHMPHVSHRLKGYMDPDADLRGRGHQPHQAKIAAGSGGVWGRGVGESLQKLNYLPAARSDYIAAIYAEEFGFVGVCVMIFLYMLMAYAGLEIAFCAKDSAAFYLAATITFLFTFQGFLNLGVASHLLPSKGTTLPFFSQGGSSLLVNFCALFVLLSVTHEKKKIRYAKRI